MRTFDRGSHDLQESRTALDCSSEQVRCCVQMLSREIAAAGSWGEVTSPARSKQVSCGGEQAFLEPVQRGRSINHYELYRAVLVGRWRTDGIQQATNQKHEKEYVAA